MLNEDTRRRMVKITAVSLAVMVGATGILSSGVLSLF